MVTEKRTGHLAALLTILIWGTTFISTKILLADFHPVEILFFRFIIGYLILLTVYPHNIKRLSWKQETTFAAAGFCGVCLYYLLENVGLADTMASNVGVIISIAPFITAILAHLFIKSEEKLQINFFIGFIVAIAGIILINFNGLQLKLNPVGDILAFAAAFVWAFYSILTKKIGSFELPVNTQDIFLWHFIYDTNTIPVRLSVKCITFYRDKKSTPYFIFGNRSICPLLCNMELCCKNIRGN